MRGKRPVFFHDSALLCARGLTPAAAAAALWRGECSANPRQVGPHRLPYQTLPLPESDWWLRGEAAVRQLASQLPAMPPETPLFVASSSFQMGGFEATGAPFDLPAASASFTPRLADWLGLTGPRYSFSNACISGFSAIDAAATLIANGLFDEALVIGVELANNTTLAGFAAMELLSSTASLPLDRDRDGLVLGEGIAAIRLSALPANWRLAAVRTGLDAHSLTGPDPSGRPLAELLAQTLTAAELAPAEIELIKLQAAGAPSTDLAEARAIEQVFADTRPPLMSLKPVLGHTLGASGIVELVALLSCLEHDQIPATAGFLTPDPEFSTVFPVHRSTLPVRRALLNLVGFGGGLAAMVIER